MNFLMQDENGVLHKGTTQIVDSKQFGEKLIEMNSIAKAGYTFLPSKLLGTKYNLFTSGTSSFVTCRQSFLNINTLWTPWKTTNDAGEEIVYFEPTFTSGRINQKVTAEFERSLVLTIDEYNDFRAFFVYKRENKLSTFYLALPNMYDDGRVCLGNGNQITGENIFERFDSAIEIFNNSVFNNMDLWQADQKKKALVSSWYIDKDFAFLNSPYEGKIKFVNSTVDEMVKAMNENGLI